jgi:hypothetical protein
VILTTDQPYPEQYLKACGSGPIQDDYPDFSPSTLERLPLLGDIYLEATYPRPTVAGVPKYLIIRLDKVVPSSVCNQIEMSYNTLASIHKPALRDDTIRSGTPAFHFGVWEKYQPAPYLTLDTRPGSTKKDVEAEVDNLLDAVKTAFASVNAFLDVADPDYAQAQRR